MNAENLKAANFIINNHFTAEGEVDLSYAELAGVLNADDSMFNNAGINSNKIAFLAENLKAVNVFFRSLPKAGPKRSGYLENGFNADGEVDLANAQLEGGLYANGGTFKNPGKIALNAEHLKAVNLIINNHFTAEGEVDLSYAELAGVLNADDSMFNNAGINSNKIAFIAENLKAVNVFFRSGFNADGEVDLANAQLEGGLYANGGTFKNSGKIALNAPNLKAVNVNLNNHFSADGEVDMWDAELAGNLDTDDSSFKNHGGNALYADNLKAADVLLTDKFNADGEVRLIGAKLEGDLQGNGGTFKNHGQIALDASGTNIAGDARFEDVSAVGEMDFIATQVKGEFVWKPARSESVFLNVSHAATGPFFDEKERWPQKGNLNLDGFVYSRFGEGGADAKSRLRWIERQTSRNRNAEFRAQPYEQLATVLRENGDDAGAKNVLIAMENTRWWYGNIGFWARWWSWILWLTIGYGYDVWRSLWFISGFLVLGTLLFFWGHESEAIVQIDKQNTEHFLWFNSFIYSLEAFLPLVELHQAKHWGPNPELRRNRPAAPLASFRPFSRYPLRFGPAFGKYLRWYLWFHVLAGYFFTSMLIAGITGLAQKV